jgi:hypothetical protein
MALVAPAHPGQEIIAPTLAVAFGAEHGFRATGAEA